jgi:S-adenosylmethionine synthetase
MGGAGDQGIMVGYACKETKELMPLPIMLAHALTKRMAETRKKNILPYLGPDGKSQVTVEYQDGKPYRVDSVVLACQHTEEILDSSGKRITKDAREEMIETIIKPVLSEYIDKNTRYYVNETGKFVIGGPQSDTGMTGRKLIVDTYGGIIPHGGGAFSGKDPTKVDRSASYMARYIAKNIVTAGLAERCAVHIAYVIGQKDPISVMVDTNNSGKISDRKLTEIIKKNLDLTPQGIIKTLNLRRPIYLKTACYGHFGRNDPEFTWERTDLTEALRKAAKL